MALKSAKEMYAAEAIGAFIIVFVSIGTAVVNVLSEGQIGLLGIAAASGFAVLVVCYSLGHVSGAHANPAVTIGFASQRKFPLMHVIPYVLAQLAGAVAACFFIYLLFGNIANFGLTQPVYSWPLVFLVEFAISFVLMLVIMGVATDTRAADPAAAGLPIGATVVMNSLFALSITGAFMNPARAFAPAVVLWDFSWQWVYWSATILGAIFGAWAYERVRVGSAPKPGMYGVLGPLE